jgi:hypothetical protein
MPTTKAAQVKRVVGAVVTEDGSHMLLKVERLSGVEAMLALPIADMASLVDLSADVLNRSDKIVRVPGDQRRTPFKVKSFELGRDRATSDAVLFLTFGLGGTLGFRLKPSMAEELSNGLAVYTTREIPPPPKKSRH